MATSIQRLVVSVVTALESDSDTLRGLAQDAGLAVERDFRNISLNGIPLSKEDVSGFDFSGSDLRGTGVDRAKRDRQTLFAGAIFDADKPSLDPSIQAFNRELNALDYVPALSKLRNAMARGG